MQSLSSNNFGLIIAYLLPGLIVLVGLRIHSPLLHAWLLGTPGSGDVTIGGFLFSTLAALLLGLICSTVRWLIVDTLHHATGIKPPKRDFRRLQQNVDAYRMVEANHYQYYQFYGNALVAFLVAFGSVRLADAAIFFPIADLLMAALCGLLYLGSRDTLAKYYARVQALLEYSETLILPARRHDISCSRWPRGR